MFFFYTVLGVIPSFKYELDYHIAMDFLFNNPGFLATPDVSQVASQDSETPPSPSGSGSSTSATSSGGSSRRNCPQCRRRMSTDIFVRHTVCLKCRGWDCYYTLAGYIGICLCVRLFVRVPTASLLYRLHFLTDCDETSHACSQTSSLVRV